MNHSNQASSSSGKKSQNSGSESFVIPYIPSFFRKEDSNYKEFDNDLSRPKYTHLCILSMCITHTNLLILIFYY